MLLPSPPTLDNYRALFTRIERGRNLRNSAVLALTVTARSLLFNSLAGYAFAKLRFPGASGSSRVSLGALAIPVQVAMLPLFLMLKGLGLVNTLLGRHRAGPRGNLRDLPRSASTPCPIPDELLEAARLDGAGEFRIYWKIVLPLLRPILVTLALFTFLGIVERLPVAPHRALGPGALHASGRAREPRRRARARTPS